MSSRPEAGVDFFRYGALPVPLVTAAEAERIAAASFGLTVEAHPLGSQQDCNYLLVGRERGGPAGQRGIAVGVLKIANPVFTAAEIEAQDAAAGHIAAVDGPSPGWHCGPGPCSTARSPWRLRTARPRPRC